MDLVMEICPPDGCILTSRSLLQGREAVKPIAFDTLRIFVLPTAVIAMGCKLAGIISPKGIREWTACLKSCSGA
jgi:hypothetical protein